MKLVIEKYTERAGCPSLLHRSFSLRLYVRHTKGVSRSARSEDFGASSHVTPHEPLLLPREKTRKKNSKQFALKQRRRGFPAMSSREGDFPAWRVLIGKDLRIHQ